MVGGEIKEQMDWIFPPLQCCSFYKLHCVFLEPYFLKGLCGAGLAPTCCGVLLSRGALLPGLPTSSTLLQLFGVAVSSDPVVEFLAIGLLTPPQHRQRAPRFLHHVHYTVQQLGGGGGGGKRQTQLWVYTHKWGSGSLKFSSCGKETTLASGMLLGRGGGGIRCPYFGGTFSLFKLWSGLSGHTSPADTVFCHLSQGKHIHTKHLRSH